MGTRQCRLGQRAIPASADSIPAPIPPTAASSVASTICSTTNTDCPIRTASGGEHIGDSGTSFPDAYPAARSGPVSDRPGVPATQSPDQTARRQGLHLTCASGLPAWQRLRTAHCPLWHRTTRTPWQMALGGLMHARPAPAFPPAAYPL